MNNSGLIVVDMQVDFVDGALGTKEAEAIVPNVINKIDAWLSSGGEIIYTRDTHHGDYLSTNGDKHLPVEHCIEGTKGWEIYPGVYHEGCKIIDKPNFGYAGWDRFSFEEVELVGLCTDICVISNALILKTIFPEIKISVDSKCCASVSLEGHSAALATMRACQVDVL